MFDMPIPVMGGASSAMWVHSHKN